MTERRSTDRDILDSINRLHSKNDELVSHVIDIKERLGVIQGGNYPERLRELERQTKELDSTHQKMGWRVMMLWTGGVGLLTGIWSIILKYGDKLLGYINTGP